MEDKKSSENSISDRALVPHMLGLILYRQGETNALLQTMITADSAKAERPIDPLWKRLPWDKLIGLFRIFGPMMQPYVMQAIAWLVAGFLWAWAFVTWWLGS